jgi:hypothetical protein
MKKIMNVMILTSSDVSRIDYAAVNAKFGACATGTSHVRSTKTGCFDGAPPSSQDSFRRFKPFLSAV